MIPIASPCAGVCRYDDAADRCEGCGRTLAEIAAWPNAGEVERRRIAALARARLPG